MINLPLKEVKDALDKIFTSAGYSINNINIKFPQPLNMTFGKDKDNSVYLLFGKSLPTISIKKFITLSAWIQGIVLSNTGGTIRLKYFPDLKFTYSSSSENNFGQIPIDYSNIKYEIIKQYPDLERQKVANLCLQYASEWVTICYSSGVSKDDFRNKKSLKKDCFNFVKESIKKDKEYGSIVGFIVLFVILPVILKWVIERIFAKLSS